MRRLIILAIPAIAIAAAPAADALTGTPEAKRLASQALSTARKVDAIRSEGSGELYYCATVRGGFLGEPSRGCRSKAKTRYTRVFRRGKTIGGFGTTSAKGEKAINFISRSTGTYHREAGTECWTRIDKEPRFSGPAYAFFPGVELSITRRTGNTAVLHGETEGFFENLTINLNSKVITREELQTDGRKQVYLHINLTSAPDLPSPTPACQD